MVFAPEQFQTAEAEQRYQQMRIRVSQFRDKLGCEVDPGIFETVVLLNLLGFTTQQSCEGHLDHGAPYPWVTIIDAEQERLFQRHWLAVCEHEEQAKASGAQEAFDRWLTADVHMRLMIAHCEQQSALYQHLTTLLETFYTQASPSGPARLLVKRFRSAATYRIEPGFAAVVDTLPPALKASYLERGRAEMYAFTAFLTHQFSVSATSDEEAKETRSPAS